MAKALSTLANGALVKDTGSNYYGTPVIWRKIDQNHTGYPSNSVTVIADKILSLKMFDGKEASNADSNRKSYGNNRYRTSNMRQWMNSSGAANAWWTAQNLTDGTANTNNKDAPPSSANSSSSSYGFYDNEAGFKTNFSANFLASVLSTTRTIAKNTVTDGGGSETVSDDFFLATETEMGLGNENGIVEGTPFAYFTDNNSRIAKPTAQCVANTSYTSGSFNVDSGWYYWLATPYASDSHSVRNVSNTGTLFHDNACNGSRGFRPLCNLKSEILVSDTPDTDGAYTILWNQPPTIPDSITVPSNILADTEITVSWGTSTDPEGALSGYKLERSLNEDAFSQIYSGTALSHKDTVPSGNTSVTYRVKAFDAAGMESGYQTSPTRTVLNNTPPTISGSDSDLGTKTGAFSQNYTVTDPDTSETITVVEKIDGVQKRSYNATSGATQAFEVTAEEFIKLANGSHALTITATDSRGASATRTYTFSRSENQIEISLTTPLAADDMPERVLLTVSRILPPGAIFQVLVCNNGNDANPAWEDATGAVLTNAIYYFTNALKTAEEWGVNVKVLVDRNGKPGECYIAAIGGNFD